MILTALSSAYSRYKPKNPLSEEAPWLLKNQVYKTLTLRAFLKTKKKTILGGQTSLTENWF